jgi:hypothetical protein
MTPPSPQPAAWAQSWIEMLAPARRRDAVLGDLLEEYHETQVPQHGVAAANRWFKRQAHGFLWSASVLPGGLMGAFIGMGVLRDPAGLPLHALALPAAQAAAAHYAVPAIFVLAGVRLGMSTRRVDGAFLVAPTVTLMASVIGFAAAFGAFGIPALVDHSPAAAAALYDGTDIPVQIMLPAGIVLTLLGAATGALMPAARLKGRT